MTHSAHFASQPALRRSRELAQAFGVHLELTPFAADRADAFMDWHYVSQIVVQVAQARGARTIGICGSQGSGKSTLAQAIVAAFASANTRGAVCSLDDFYLTKAERERLAQTIHPLLRTRGVPGTHDHGLLHAALTAFSDLGRANVPRFDKAVDDRAGFDWVEGEYLIFEGWCVGVHAQPAAELPTPCNTLERTEDTDGVWRTWVNDQIRAHYEPIWPLVDLWVYLKAPSFQQVFEWRWQQEQQLPEERRFSEPELERFIAHYERLTRHIWASPMHTPALFFALDPDHRVNMFRSGSVPAA